MLEINKCSPVRHLQTGRVQVTNVPKPLTVDNQPVTRGVTVSNIGATGVFVGDSQVTVNLGFPVPPGDSVKLKVDDASAVFVVGGPSTVAYSAI